MLPSSATCVSILFRDDLPIRIEVLAERCTFANLGRTEKDDIPEPLLQPEPQIWIDPGHGVGIVEATRRAGFLLAKGFPFVKATGS